MVKAGAVFTFVAVLMFAVVPGAQAISIVSDTTWTCTGISGTACAGATAVSAVPAPIPPWAPETTGDWITSTNSAVALGSQTAFSTVIDFGSGSVLTLKVWADDTAGVTLSGGGLSFDNPGSAPNPVLDAACAAGVLGCEANEFGSFSTGVLTGLHTLTVTVDQLVGSTPFGTLVEGDLTPVPEPATILLLGSALAAAGVASRRFRKAEAPKA
ncbi:MAG TPA: PEP-CTERM sorting domain-containing protein [Gemmatimonadales bacterium]|nr:PEP-CTERM sorting domain-containing protein [Gemmatimonadales bacterium]